MCIGNLWGKGDGGLSLDGNWNFFIICLAQECKAAVWRGMWDLAAGLGVQVKCHASEQGYPTLACLGKGPQLQRVVGAGCSYISAVLQDLFSRMHQEESLLPNNFSSFFHSALKWVSSPVPHFRPGCSFSWRAQTPVSARLPPESSISLLLPHSLLLRLKQIASCCHCTIDQIQDQDQNR